MEWGKGQKEKVKWIIINLHDQTLRSIYKDAGNLREIKNKFKIETCLLYGQKCQIAVLNQFSVSSLSHIPMTTYGGIPGLWKLYDTGHKPQKEGLFFFGSTGQRQKTREKEKEEKKSLSSHPHYVNEVHDCSVGPSRVNYQWLLSLIG